MKFLLVVLGLQSASSKFLSPFCYADAKERCNLSLPSSHFNSPPLARTMANLNLDSDVLIHGVQYLTIFQVEPALVVPDTFHMCLQILHVLLDNVIIEIKDFDSAFQVRTPRVKNQCMDKCVDVVNSCVVKFEVWQNEKKVVYVAIRD